MIFDGCIADFKLHIYSLTKYEQFLKKNDGKKLVVVLDEKGDIRSYAQNRFYWGVLIKELLKLSKQNDNMILENEKIYQTVHWKPEIWHMYLKYWFISYYVKEFDKWEARSTQDLSVKDFMGYINSVIDEAIVKNGGQIMQKDWDNLMETMEGKK